MSRLQDTVEAFTPARQAAGVAAVNVLAWMPDADTALKVLGVLTAVVMLAVQIETWRLRHAQRLKVERETDAED